MGKMTVEEKIRDIKRLLDHQTNNDLLDIVHTILTSSAEEHEKRLLLDSIHRGKEDIKHGRVHTPKQALERIYKRFKK